MYFLVVGSGLCYSRLMQKGFSKNYGEITTLNIGAGGSHSYWKKRVAYARIARDYDMEAKKRADLERRRKVKAKIARLDLLRELVKGEDW